MNEFRTIPGYSRYKINIRGVCFNVLDDKEINWHNSNGYKFCKLVSDESGERVSVGLHRVLCLTFIPIPDEIIGKNLIVNHKDGNKSNNLLSNLEWCTYSDNNKHAYNAGLRKDSIILVVQDNITKEKNTFYTLSSCCKALNINYDAIKQIISNKNNNRYSIKIIRNRDTGIRKLYTKGICVKNISDNKIIIFASVTDVGKYVKVHQKVISKILRKKKFQYPINGFDIRFLEDNLKWPKYSNEEIEAFKTLKFIHQPVTVKRNNISILFGSVLKAAEYTGIPQRSVRQYIKDKTISKNGYEFIRYNKPKLNNV